MQTSDTVDSLPALHRLCRDLSMSLLGTSLATQLLGILVSLCFILACH